MKSGFFIGALLLLAMKVQGQQDSIQKIATIIYFTVDHQEVGMSDSAMLAPFHDQLRRLFKLDDIIDLEEPTVTYTGGSGNGLPSKRKLRKHDFERIESAAPLTTLIVSIRVDHSYNPIFGGFIRGRRHVMWLNCSVFNRQGKRIWRNQQKTSCCADIIFGEKDPNVVIMAPMEPASFVKLYQELVGKMFPVLN